MADLQLVGDNTAHSAESAGVKGFEASSQALSKPGEGAHGAGPSNAGKTDKLVSSHTLPGVTIENLAGGVVETKTLDPASGKLAHVLDQSPDGSSKRQDLDPASQHVLKETKLNKDLNGTAQTFDSKTGAVKENIRVVGGIEVSPLYGLKVGPIPADIQYQAYANSGRR